MFALACAFIQRLVLFGREQGAQLRLGLDLAQQLLCLDLAELIGQSLGLGGVETGQLGADDYVPKPCTPRELSARLRAILKRLWGGSAVPAEDAQELVVGKLQLWPGRRKAGWRGAPLALTSTEFSLLEVLARHAGTPVTKETLSQQALGRPLARFDRSIDVHISSIRHKLGLLPDGNSPIETVIRKGYLPLRS